MIAGRGKRKDRKRKDSNSEDDFSLPKKRRGDPPKLNKPEWEIASESEREDRDHVPKKCRSQPPRAAAAERGTNGNFKDSIIDSGSDNSDSDGGGSIAYKNYGVTRRPSRAVLGWIHIMSPKEQQKNVHVGMSVKVRFENDVWYGGMIASVLS